MLTRRQFDLLSFLREHARHSPIAPSFDEMAVALKLRSKAGIHRFITTLAERGFIRRPPNRARAIEVIRFPEVLESPSEACALTYPQLQLLRFIDERIKKTGASPSGAEMSSAMGFRSKEGTRRHVTALVKHGFVSRIPHAPYRRGLKVIKTPPKLSEVLNAVKTSDDLIGHETE